MEPGGGHARVGLGGGPGSGASRRTRVDRVRIRGYRSLLDVDLPLHGLNVLIGPNGAGKTSLIEVFLLLADAMNERLASALSDLGGIAQVLTRDVGDSVLLELEAPSKAFPHPLRYELEIAPLGVGYEIKRERLSQEQTRGPERPFVFVDNVPGRPRFFWEGALVAPTWEFDEKETALAQMSRTLRTYPETEELRRGLASVAHFATLDVSKRAVVRLPQELRPVSAPGANGQDLYAFLYTLRADHPDRYERLQDILRVAFPGFRQAEFPLVASGQATMAWYDVFSKPLYPPQLSEGTLRFIWLAALLLSPNPPGITLIDEPEVSLHPELLRLLAGLLQEASMRTQLIVATHADRLIRWLKPDEVLIADKSEGASTLTRADTLDLKQWLEEYTLDELWLMGEIGGRP